MTSLLFLSVIFLGAATIAVPIAKRLGLGSVLGYLIAGIAIAPILRLVGADTESIQHVAEFGVVLMLFIVGLELEPRALWDMRKRLLGLGGFQLGLTTLGVMAFCVGTGQSWRISLAIGLIFALSSTAIVLQTLNERGLMKSDGGQSAFSVLLFQDIAVIPMLALLPLLVMPNIAIPTAGGGEAEYSLIKGMSGWQIGLTNIAAIAAVVLGGHYLSRPLFRFIAGAKLREVFTAAALFLVVGIAFLMTLVGLSPALGAFLAGVVLANSEFRHELESNIEPFKGLLLGLFFITVGAGINFPLLFENAALIFGLTLALMAMKAAVLAWIAIFFKLKGADRWLFTLSLAQAGEFGFVLLSLTVQNKVIPDGLAQLLLLVVALSMLLTPLLFILFERVILPRLDAGQAREADAITEQGSAIVAGMGRFGQIINRVLRSNGFTTTVLDQSADTVANFNAFGMPTFYGDASRPELLHAAGLEKVNLLVVAIDDREQTIRIVKHARQVRPDLHIIARAYDRQTVYDLYQAGATDIVRETFDSALRASRYALMAKGMTEREATRRALLFQSKDRDGVRRLAALYDPEMPGFQNKPYMELAQKIEAEIAESMKRDDHEHVVDTGHKKGLPKNVDP